MVYLPISFLLGFAFRFRHRGLANTRYNGFMVKRRRPVARAIHMGMACFSCTVTYLGYTTVNFIKLSLASLGSDFCDETGSRFNGESE